jgi:hypothetical protein
MYMLYRTSNKQCKNHHKNHHKKHHKKHNSKSPSVVVIQETDRVLPYWTVYGLPSRWYGGTNIRYAGTYRPGYSGVASGGGSSHH